MCESVQILCVNCTSKWNLVPVNPYQCIITTGCLLIHGRYCSQCCYYEADRTNSKHQCVNCTLWMKIINKMGINLGLNVCKHDIFIGNYWPSGIYVWHEIQ